MLQSNMHPLHDEAYIILLDIKMPQMDGFEFLNEFAQLPEEIKSKFSIYLLSAYLDNDYELKAKEYHVIKDCIHKPLSVQSFSETIFRKISDPSSLN